MKDYSLKSGERCHTLDLNLIAGDHLWRYRYAAARMKNHEKRLFGADIFCGSGYGSAILANEVNSAILAIDGSEESIAVAGNKIHNPNIIWSSKLFPFNLPHECFDFITSMESIEHVKDHKAFLLVLTKSLKKGGRLFISCPNENVIPYAGYKWHYKHFLPAEMRELALENGLEEVNAFSTICTGLKEGVSAILYPYQLKNDQPLDIEVGDTMFFEFIKK